MTTSEAVYPFQRIATTLRRQFESGIWTAGQRIPSEIQLAEEFNVSKPTVKRAIKILEEEGLLYGGRGSGRFVSKSGDSDKSIRTLGVLILEDHQHWIFSQSHPAVMERINGIEQVAHEHQAHLSIQIAHPNILSSNIEVTRRNLAELMRRWGMDAAIVYSQTIPFDDFLSISSEIPVVFPVDHNHLKQGAESVREDGFTAMYDAVHHLLELGHKDIAMISTSPIGVGGLSHSIGAKIAIHSFGGGDCRVNHIQAACYSFDEGTRVMREILAMNKRPTAVICGSSELTAGAIEVLAEEKIRIPEDLSLVASTGSWRIAGLSPKATRIKVDFVEIGKRVAEQAFDLLKNPDQLLEPVFVPIEFIVGETTSKLK